MSLNKTGLNNHRFFKPSSFVETTITLDSGFYAHDKKQIEKQESGRTDFDRRNKLRLAMDISGPASTAQS
jgi:hypothetical protein